MYSVVNIQSQQENITVGCIPPTFLILRGKGSLYRDKYPGQRPPRQRPLDKDPLDRDPQTETLWTETPWTKTPGRNMGPGSQTESDIIQRPPLVNRMSYTCFLKYYLATNFVSGQ